MTEPCSWDFMKKLPPCRLCDQPLKGWATSDGVHFECAQQYPDAMFGGPTKEVTP